MKSNIFERNSAGVCLFKKRRRSFCSPQRDDFGYDGVGFQPVRIVMIEVSNLTKRYAGRTAVDDISFTVARGEIVGLLGPNGAGKSTTMRVLAGFMPATHGTVRVAGFDVFHDSDEARQRIGYMPENNPLYTEMRVREYLKFRARLKGLGWKKSRERVSTVMEQCGLADVGRRVIGQLSKGYKQRVGLADALVHDPELIILDEPTIGLDPHQIRSVRALIKSLAGKHTVLISTHILPEVAQSDVSATDGEFFRCALTPRDGQDLRPVVFALAQQNRWTLRELTRSRHSLEDIYVQVTKPTTEAVE